MKIPTVFFSAASTSGRPNHLRKVRRANFFLAFGYQNKVYRQLAACASDGMQRR